MSLHQGKYLMQTCLPGMKPGLSNAVYFNLSPDEALLRTGAALPMVGVMLVKLHWCSSTDGSFLNVEIAWSRQESFYLLISFATALEGALGSGLCPPGSRPAALSQVLEITRAKTS